MSVRRPQPIVVLRGHPEIVEQRELRFVLGGVVLGAEATANPVAPSLELVRAHPEVVPIDVQGAACSFVRALNPAPLPSRTSRLTRAGPRCPLTPHPRFAPLEVLPLRAAASALQGRWGVDSGDNAAAKKGQNLMPLWCPHGAKRRPSLPNMGRVGASASG